MQQTTLYSLGVFHFDQIAAWSEENVAWVDQYLRLQGRIGEEEWVEQARDLARDGPAAARRVLQDEDV
jgi:NADH-quinone oxidoreductase subunit E